MAARACSRECELRGLLVVAHVVHVTTARVGIRLAARLRGLVLVVAGAVDVLVVDLVDGARADALHVPHVRRSPGLGVYLLPKGLPSPVWQAEKHPRCSKAGRADVPDHRPLVLVVEVVVASLVVRVPELLPRAVGLLLPGLAPDAVGLVLVLHEEVDGIGRVDGADGHLGRAVLKPAPAEYLDGHRSGSLPARVHRPIQRRRRRNLLGRAADSSAGHRRPRRSVPGPPPARRQTPRGPTSKEASSHSPFSRPRIMAQAQLDIAAFRAGLTAPALRSFPLRS